MELNLFWVVLVSQVYLCASVHNGSLGNIEFACPQGQHFTGGFCVMLVPTKMDWWSAMVTCKRHGYELFWADDIDDYKDIDHIVNSAYGTWTDYWSGLYLANGSSGWTYESKDVALHEIYWENSQPDPTKGQCAYAKKNGHFSFGNCLHKLPYVCKSYAVLKGYFRCRNGEGIREDLKCDGHNDCGDFSDEINCGTSNGKCSTVVDAQSVNSGTISSSGTYGNGNTCFWTIVAGIGQTIKVTVKSFQTEKNTDVLNFRTGGMSGDIYLGELTGTSVGQRTTYYSSDNVFLLRFITDNTVTDSGFSIDWTTNVPEVFNDVRRLTATSSVQELKSPFYGSGYLPHEKVLEWIITADTENVVTLEFITIKLGNLGRLYLWDGEEKTLNPTLNGVRELKSNIYISRSRSVRLMLRTEGGGIAAFNEGLDIHYREGCNVTHQLSDGMIQSPGFLSGSYPDNVTCQWTIRRPSADTRHIALRFNSFQIQSESDYLKIFNDSQWSSPIHSGEGFTGSAHLTDLVFHSTTGTISVEFVTNYVLNDKGFEAEFSLDCPAVTVSSHTIVNSNQMYETSFRSEVTLTCVTGYSFKQEEFNAMSAVTIRCERGGEWNVTRIPDCIITYCSIPPIIENGFISSSSGVVYGANITYACNDGFDRDGDEVIKCSEAGKWSTPPTCQATGCSAITAPRNGALDVLEGGGTDYASVIRFRCDEGYDLVGNLTIHCMTGGVWSHDIPVCEEIWCPLPSISDGSLDTSSDLRFGMKAELKCSNGYGINGSETTSKSFTCGADGLLDITPCLDIDECEGSSSPCSGTEDCDNTIGGHKCVCKDGYERETPSSPCTNINECLENPCDANGKCHDDTPGYTCSCNSGFLLYKGDGFNNISLADGETGLIQGDVYRIDHTCVRRQCLLPSNIANGEVLTKKELIFYEDDVEFVCNHGYIPINIVSLKCESNGEFSDSIPTCQVATCIKPKRNKIARAVEVYPVTVPVVNYGTEVTIECQYGSVRINRTMFCSYDVMTGQYEMMGDAPECPEIDCGDPEKVPGSVYRDGMATVLGSTFTFDCEAGFTKSGMSLDGTSTVTCQENGRWNLGNLTCSGGRCTDPGTPGGATQNVKSYEVGQILSFTCNNPGFYPDPPEPLECIVDNTGTVMWNSTDLPECADQTPPVFTNCRVDPIFIDKSEVYSYTVPTATDNSGSVKSVTNLTPDKGPGQNTNTDISIVYQAEDYSGNTANCTVQIKIKDYAGHSLKCQSYPTNRRAIYTAEGVTYNVSDYVSINNNMKDITVQYSPMEFIPLDYRSIGNPQVVEVTATDKWGRHDKCRIHLETVADGCFKESFPDVENGVESCTSGDVSCTLTCNTGYIMFDGNSTKTYDCEGGNKWTPALPPQYACIEYDEPAYLIEFMVVYTIVQIGSGTKFAFDCVDGMRQLLLNNLKSTLTSEINGFCNNALVQAGDVEITDIHVTTTSFDFLTTYTIRLLDDTTTTESRQACYSILALQVSKTDFLDFTNTVSCSSGSSTVIKKEGSENKMISQGNSCSAGIKKATVIGEKCIKCPPGTYSSSGDVCTECPDGQFQNLYGQPSCIYCPSSTPVPSSDKTTCLAQCPPGFISDDGLPSCWPCPEDTYWVNSTHCEQCPDGGRTLGFDGVLNLPGCALPCLTGQYSVTGYAPCKPCPENFYQDQIGQDQCLECSSSRITKGPGANSSNDCINLLDNMDCGFSNLSSLCNGNGQCRYDGHGTVCRCEPGYVGERCEIQLDPCSSSPCWNGGTCTKTGYDTFNCTCPVDTSCEMIREPNTTGSDGNWNREETKLQPSIEACEQYCLESPKCLAVHYTVGWCFVYHQDPEPHAKLGSTYSFKTCKDTQLFGGGRCGKDLINSCKNDTCSEYGMCQDLLGENTKCLCPVTGVFTGDTCIQESNLCDPNPCVHGDCVPYDNVRYQCICRAGYSGVNCDVDINECSLNPKGCFYNGTCHDRVNGYDCICENGFHGDRCKDVPDFCAANPCPVGICYSDYDKFGYTCKCEPPYRLSSHGTCEPIPPCEGVVCVNGTCSDGKCQCDPRSEGSRCQHNIDDCRNNPCKHGGQCVDLISDYQCYCRPGYDGKNCSRNIPDCNGVCTDSNVERCEDLVDDYRCICKPGYTGRNCTDDIDECGSYPCRHGGGCTNLVNDFSCQCRQGWTGKQCEYPEDFCSSAPCQNGGACYNMTDGFYCRCLGGTKGNTCEDSPNVCSVITPCVNSGTCENVDGTARCTCTDSNYNGTSCQLITDHCGNDNTCKNDGKCITQDMGYRCECTENYSGQTCGTYSDPCSSNPCHSSARCYSDKDHRHMCYCVNGGYLTENGCKAMNENFDLYMDKDISDLPGFLRTPMIIPQGSDMTIMFWFRVIGSEPTTLLTLEQVSLVYPYPLFHQYIVKIQTNRILVSNYTSNDTIEYDTDKSDGQWHFLVLSWERNGNTKVFIDSVSAADRVTVSADQLPEMLQVIFGSDDTNGRISRLKIYSAVFSNEDIFKANQGTGHLSSNKLVQTWANLAFTRSTFPKYPSQVRQNICDKGFPVCQDDREKPTVTCPDDRYKTGDRSTLTTLTGLKADAHYFNVPESRRNNSIHEDEVYTFGRTNEVFIGYDEAMNYGICRFKVYVKYSDDCEIPQTDAVIGKCFDSSSICNLTCDGLKSLSIDHRNIYTCGRLGVFNYQNPWKKFILPTCGATQTQKIALTIKLIYRLVINCTSNQETALKTKLTAAVNQIGQTWQEIPCPVDGCPVTTSCADLQKSPEVKAEIRIPNLGPTTTWKEQTVEMKEAVLIIIYEQNKLQTKEIADVAGASLLRDSVMVTVSPSCPSGYVVLGNTCVQCGKGSYRNDTTMTCEFCPIGSYQASAGSTSCTQCTQGKTTLTYGMFSSSDCVDNCPPGKFYDGQSCADCAKDHYQNMSGQEFCYRCPLGYKTGQPGSKSFADCYDDCDAGTELQPNGSCKICPRGYYRAQTEDSCLSCGAVFTTEGEGTKSVTDCNIRICRAGNYRNETSNECKACPVGQYQSEDLQDDCDKCPDAYTTDGEGKTDRSSCQFYCPEGEEVVSKEDETCRPCPRGSYRSNTPDQILMNCIACTDGNTTETERSVSSDACSIRRCNAGQFVNSKGECVDCPIDTYQVHDMPTSETQCTPCSSPNTSPKKGTLQPGSKTIEDCQVICGEGQQYNGGSCSACPQGTWNNGNQTMRFQMCEGCTTNWTTIGSGSTHPDNCTLRDCDPGYYIVGEECEPCDFGQYQPNRHASSCMNCGVNQNTSTIASTKQSACQIYCGAGESGTVSCSSCLDNYIKPSAGLGECEECKGNYTSNADHTACSVLHCDEGLYQMGDSCVPCDVGKYKDQRGNGNTCTECDAGFTTADLGSSSKDDCNVLNCVAGKFKNDTSNMCELCPVKTFKSDVGNGDCQPCAGDKTTNGRGSTRSSDCSLSYCSPGQRRTDDNICEDCPVGTYQPESGTTQCLPCGNESTTSGVKKTNQSECYEICAEGSEFHTTTKTCHVCALGSYKSVVGNNVNCTACPVGNTTASVNSTSIKDCNIADCDKGSKRDGGGCTKCEKGTYQPDRSASSCIPCGSDKTTESTGAKDVSECIGKCGDGNEYNLIKKTCEVCPLGFHTIRPTTEKCVQCPPSTTTVYPGHNVCTAIKGTTPAPTLPATRTLKFTFKFKAQFDCNNAKTARGIYLSRMRDTVINRLIFLAITYPDICGPTPCSMDMTIEIKLKSNECEAIEGKRRRRAAKEHDLDFEVVIPGVPTTVNSTSSNQVRQTDSILEEDVITNLQEYNPEPNTLVAGNATIDLIVDCGEGRKLLEDGTSCVPCPAGTKKSSSDSDCVPCSENYYQDMAGQTSCIQCSGVKKYTLSENSTSCVSECVKTPDYCNNRGTCKEDTHSVYCQCSSIYVGTRCENTAARTSSTPAIIGGAVGGGVAFFLIILIIVLLCKRFYSSDIDKVDERKLDQMGEADVVDYYNPMYAYVPRLRPQQMRAIQFNTEWETDHDPYQPYKAQNRASPYAMDTYSSGSPRGHHEWYATS